MSKTVLYDLPSKSPSKAWSLNPWKTRMILNYKGVDYRTEWIEYPDVESRLKSFGIPPNDPNDPTTSTDYSIPAIQFEDGTYLMDSWPIAHELEKRYPSPSLHLDDPIVVQVRDHIQNLMKPLVPSVMPKVPRVLLNKSSAEYFERTREKRFGMPLSQLEQEQASEQNWEDIQAPAKEMADLLRKKGGPFFLGKTVSYADLIFVSFLHLIKRVDSTIFQRLLALDSAFGAVYDASEQWLKKDD